MAVDLTHAGFADSLSCVQHSSCTSAAPTLQGPISLCQLCDPTLAWAVKVEVILQMQNVYPPLWPTLPRGFPAAAVFAQYSGLFSFQDSQRSELLETFHKLTIPEPGTSVHLGVVSVGEMQTEVFNIHCLP